MVQPASAWTPRDREQQLNAAFFDDLLNQRMYYAEALTPLADQTYEAAYIETAFHSVPEVLLDHVTADGLSGAVSLKFGTGKDGDFNLRRFEIQLHDGSQIELKADWLSTTVAINGEDRAMYLDPDVATDVMRCLLPFGSPDVSPAALAFALYSHGQRQSHTMKVASQDSLFTFNSEETRDDSTHLMEIDAHLPEHASGKTIVLRATIVEGLMRATRGINSGRSLDIAAVPAMQLEDSQLYVQQITDQKTVRVERLTQVHREIITSTLKDLVRAAREKRRADKKAQQNLD